MPDLNDMVLFARVVDAGSFSGAARRMNASKSRVSKAVARLERALGARLLNRSTRRLSLTEPGAAFYRHCSRIVQEAALAKQVVSEHQAMPRGLLKLSAPVVFGSLHVAPALPAFLERYPEVRIDMSLSDRAVDLVQDGFDLAISITHEPPPALVARKIATAPRVLCAAPGYLERGEPRAPEDLASHNCLTNGESSWRLRGREGEVAVPIAGTLRVDDDEALWHAVRGGLGLALLPLFLVREDLHSGRLIAVLGDYPPADEIVYALRLPGPRVAPKVQVLIDYLSARFDVRASARDLRPTHSQGMQAESGEWKPAAENTVSAFLAPMAA